MPPPTTNLGLLLVKNKVSGCVCSSGNTQGNGTLLLRVCPSTVGMLVLISSVGGDVSLACVQGFPDSFRFHGNVHNKHRQIGNAVPVPLAKALGRQLRAALEATAHAQAQALLSAQLGG